MSPPRDANRLARHGMTGAAGVATLVVAGALGCAGSWKLALSVLALGALGCGAMWFVMQARPAARKSPSTPQGSPLIARLERLQDTLRSAPVPESSRAAILATTNSLIDQLRAHIPRERALDRAVSTLSGTQFQADLEAARERGDPEEIGLREKAVADWEALTARQDALEVGRARIDAAFDALELLLARMQAEQGEARPPGAEALIQELDALRAAIDELSGLEG